MTLLINAENLVLGRMSAFAAKQALLGEEIRIVNCEKAIITGNKKGLIKAYSERLELGQPQQGPFIQRRPDLFVRRTIRGMLPRKQAKGKEAYARVKCYMGMPAEIKGESTEIARARPSTNIKAYMTVGQLCMHLGDNKRSQA